MSDSAPDQTESSQTGSPLPADLSRLAALFDLTGKRALVTGAASGLGRAIAVGLAQHGADVATADLNLDGAEATSSVLRGLGRQSVSIGVDVRDWDQVRTMVEQAHDALGSIDVSFNIPGINIRKLALEMTPEEFRQVIDVNLVGVYHCARAVGDVMVRQRGGRMVSIASMMGHIGGSNSAAYTASKHAVVGLTKVLAIEWARYGVRVNALCPGFTRSALTAPWTAIPEVVSEREEHTPLGRLADPWEMVGPALYLVSDASNFMTGASLIVDGGWTIQ